MWYIIIVWQGLETVDAIVFLGISNFRKAILPRSLFPPPNLLLLMSPIFLLGPNLMPSTNKPGEVSTLWICDMSSVARIAFGSVASKVYTYIQTCAGRVWTHTHSSLGELCRWKSFFFFFWYRLPSTSVPPSPWWPFAPFPAPLLCKRVIQTKRNVTIPRLSLTWRLDVVQDLFLKELKGYKPTPVSYLIYIVSLVCLWQSEVWLCVCACRSRLTKAKSRSWSFPPPLR